MTEWVTLDGLAALAHPDLPRTERGLRDLAACAWRGDPALWRIAGGVAEYHVAALPLEVRVALDVARRAAVPAPQSPAWAAFERLPKGLRDRAEGRLAVVLRAADLARATSLGNAAAMAAEEAGVGLSTLQGWLRDIRGLPRAEWLPALAPRIGGGAPESDCDPRAWDHLASNWLRPDEPNVSVCLEWMRDAAKAHGWGPIPSDRTLRRRLQRIPRAAAVVARGGRDKAKRLYPHQTRTRAHLAPLQMVNADGHKFDVFVTAPWRDKPFRPVMVAVQDLFSGKIVGWRLGETECWPLVRLAFLDMLASHGVPERAYLDNGRAFASKWMSGGQVTRFRFKVLPGEPEGLLTRVGMEVRWTTPYHGQAKPIERAFRDLVDHIAHHPSVAGAGTGNSVANKPDSYGSRAIPFAVFEALVSAEIARHNARPGRRAAACAGRSFDATYAEAAAGALITQASPAQLRMFALESTLITADRDSGEVRLMGARYWAAPLIDWAGRKLIVRFDPQRLSAPVSVHQPTGELICEAAAQDVVRYDDAEAAQRHSRRVREFEKLTRATLQAERRLSIDEVAALLPEVPPPAAPARPGAVRLVTRGSAVRAAWADEQDQWQAETEQALSRAIGMLEAGVIRFPAPAPADDDGI